MRMHVDRPAPLARTIRPSVHPALEMVIAGALAKTPDQRFASAPALATALREVARQLPVDQQPLRARVDGVVPTTPADPRTIATAAPAPHPSFTPTSMPTSSLGLPPGLYPPPMPIELPPPRPRRRSRGKLALAVASVLAGVVGGAVIATQIAGGPATPASVATAPTPLTPTPMMPAPITPTPTPTPTPPRDPRVPPPSAGAPVASPPGTRAATPILELVDEATRIARGIAPDAVFVGYESAWTVGGVALTLPGSEVEVTFVVPSQQLAHDPSLPANAQPAPRCRLAVTITADETEHVFYPGRCDVPPPVAVCATDWVLARAARKGVDPTLALDIQLYRSDGTSYWIVSDSRSHDGVSVANDCMALKPGEVVPATLPPLRVVDDTESFTVPLGVDPSAFDPVAFIPTALAFARLMDPAAKLDKLSAEPLTAAGHMRWGSLRKGHSEGVRYELGGATYCSLIILISDDGSDITVIRHAKGKHCVPRHPAPTCTTRQLVGPTAGIESVSLYYEHGDWYVRRVENGAERPQEHIVEPCPPP